MQLPGISDHAEASTRAFARQTHPMATDDHGTGPPRTNGKPQVPHRPPSSSRNSPLNRTAHRAG